MKELNTAWLCYRYAASALKKNSFYPFFISVAGLVFFQFSAQAQTFSSNNPGNFGIDGDLYSDYAMTGSFTAAGSHDWFYKSGGTGNGVFDTSGNFYASNMLSQGLNYSFSKRLQYARYTTIGAIQLLDATYFRDDIGAGTVLDKTTFSGTGNKSVMDPSTWTTKPVGANVNSKSDIVDAFIHMRRLVSTNNHMIICVGATSLGTTGNRYFDFEFYKSKISYDQVTGLFSNSGPATTGGHSAFVFNADGSISSFGDLTLSFSFSSSSVNSLDLYIWTDYNSYKNSTPQGFDFDASSAGWNGISSNSGYGYVHILPKTGTSLSFWGMVNTANTTAPPWGTNSKDIGVLSQNFYSASYAAGQFGEAAVDVTSLGIDPLMGVSADPCTPPYTRVLVKSRSSSSFSANLEDFTRPIEFLDVPVPSASILAPATLTCSTTSLNLRPSVPDINTHYSWSTSTGSFLSTADTSTPVINKPGKYYLRANPSGCSTSSMDSVMVLQDIFPPVALGAYTGVLTTDPASQVTLWGGDPVASNYLTSFGGSQGLTWNWTGPGGFNSALQNPTANTSGVYNLTVTEKRNGCTSLASVTVMAPISPLATNLSALQGYYNQNQKTMVLNWQADNALSSDNFEVQRSTDGTVFTTIGLVKAKDNVQHYLFEDKIPMPVNYYRLRIKTASAYKYSPTIKMVQPEGKSSVNTYINSAGELVIQYLTSVNENILYHVYNTHGQIITSGILKAVQGQNLVVLNEIEKWNRGIYFLRITGKQGLTVKKILR